MLYPLVVAVDFLPIVRVINRKIQELGNPSRMMFFGHSLGGRLAIEVGATGTNGQVPQIDICDSAGPGFDFTSLDRDPKTGGKNVQCIQTSTSLGTMKNACHQDWRMGSFCGMTQTMSAVDSHQMCTDLYNKAFTKTYAPNDSIWNFMCLSTRPADVNSEACRGARMGYHKTFDWSKCRGDIFADI